MTSAQSALLRSLTDTLEHAVRAPYYQRTIGKLWREVKSPGDLGRLPLLDKQTAIRNQRDLIVGEPPPGFGIASSGTTRAADLPALNVRRSAAELRAIRGDDSQPEEPDPNDPYPGWTLVVVGVHHGLPLEPPGRDEIRVPWSYHKNALSMIEAVLADAQPDGRRVTAMRVSAGALKTFAAYVVERGIDPKRFSVRLIGTNGSRVSPFWRDFVGGLLDAEIFDNFSLSELPTPATECKACGNLHFGWPPLLYEVLDLKSGKQRDTGSGRLVLTSLVPYVQTMPLIRYDTGDAVEIGPVCEVTGAEGIRYLGRVRRGIVLPRGDGAELILAPAAVQDVLESLPDTERNSHPAVTGGLVRARELGLPRWTVEQVDVSGGPPIARLSFELRYDPRIFRAQAVELEKHVEHSLIDLDPALASAIEDRAVKLEVRAAPPGSLDPPGDKFE